MDLIKLLDLANPKKVKETINNLLLEYASFTEQNSIATNTAVATANKALDNSNAALSDSSAALQYAEQASQDSQDAVNTAIDAKETSDDAYAFATNAFTTSEEAISYADQAYDNANEAMRIAETADAIAVAAREDSVIAVQNSINANNASTTAVNTANSAYTKADTALTNSSTALVAANSANTKADTAVQNAQAAVTKADTALTTSNTANTAATNAVSTANSALEIVNDAYTKSKEAVNTANAAKTTADGIDAKATQALANSQVADLNADSAKKTAEEALKNVTEGLGTKVTANGVLQDTWDSDTKASVEDLKEYAFNITGDGFWSLNTDGTIKASSGTISAKYHPLRGKEGFTNYTLVRSNNLSTFVTAHNNLHAQLSTLESAVNQAIEDVSGDIEKFYKKDSELTQAITNTANAIPTKVSDLDNDAGFITQDSLPTDYVTTNTSQTITASKKFNGYVYLGSSITMLGDTNGTITVGKNNDANCTPTIKMRSNANGNDYDVMITASNGGETDRQGTLEITSGKITHNGVEVATKNEIPTKTSELTNDSGFITKSGFSMRASSTPLKMYYNEGDGEIAIQLNAPNIPQHTLSLVPSGTQIPKDGNLDLNSIDYIKVGLYYCSADATVQTLSNRPTDRAFMMEVYTPLSTAVDNETTSAWVYRIRKLMTYTGDQYIQSVSSGSTVGSFTYGAWSRIAKASEIPSSSGFVKTSGGQEIDGYKKFLQDLNVGPSLTLLNSPNGGIEIGRRDGTTSTPYIDFHTDGNAINVTDYNVRMIASGGTAGKNGDGTLNISAGKLTLNGVNIPTTTSVDTQINNKLNPYQLQSTLLDKVYPIGSIYMSVNDVDPSFFIGGTWERLTDRFLIGAGNSYSKGATGGSTTHTLTINEMPSHTHTQNSHSHTIYESSGSVAGIPAGGDYSVNGVFSTSNINNNSVNTWGSSNGKRVTLNFKQNQTSTAGTTATNNNTGGGQAHNNMPPYLAVYMWKRTA